MSRNIFSAACLGLFLLGWSHAASANLLSNPGFETGALGPWTGSGASIDSVFPHAGIYDAALGTVSDGPAATLSQSVTTVPGSAYSLSLFLLDQAFSPFDSFTVEFGKFSATVMGEAAFDQTTANNYAAELFTIPGSAVTGTSTTLLFSAVNPNASFNVDDVVLIPVVQTVPEPAGFAVLLTGLAGVLAVRRWRL